MGVLGDPFSAPFPQDWCLVALMSRGAGSLPQPYPTLFIILASGPVSTTWQASQQQGQDLSTVYFLVNICLLAQGSPPRATSSPRLRAPSCCQGYGRQAARLPPCPNWSTAQTPRAQDVGTLAESPSLNPAPRAAETRTEAPRGMTSISLLISASLGPQRGLKRRS